MIAGQATAEGTARFAAAAAGTAAGHFRRTSAGLTLSSIGLGTYLGAADDATDAAVAAAGQASLAAGVNVFDAAINYRCQRAERSLGRLFAGLSAAGRLDRGGVFVSTKAGYLPFDGGHPADPSKYIRDTYLKTGIIAAGELVGAGQCIAPNYLMDQIRRSRANLGLATIDLFYLHNPEYMIPELGRPEWTRRMELAFRALEQAADQGLIASYGVATWDGFRAGPDRAEHLELSELLGLAAAARGGGRHRFAAVQLPISLAATEAHTAATQTSRGRPVPLLAAAAEAGVTVFASAPLLQGKALRGVTPALAAKFPQLAADGQRALQWVRSLPGVTTALVGMKTAGHVRENLALAAVPPAVI